jgi:hypothetical protein
MEVLESPDEVLEVAELSAGNDTISQRSDNLPNRKIKGGVNNHVIKNKIQSISNKGLLS